jgi:hypothetical protein
VVSLHEVSLHIGSCIPDLIVVLDVVGVENVHALCLFNERPRVKRNDHLFPFVTSLQTKVPNRTKVLYRKNSQNASMERRR